MLANLALYFIATADPALTSAMNTVTDYFTDNIGVVIAAFVGIAVLLWLLSKFLRAVGIRGRVA